MSVVISGAGLVTGYGAGADTYWRRLLAGDTAVAAPQRFDTTPFGPGVVAECPLRPAGDRAALARPAVAEALTAARLHRLPDRTLVVTVAQSPVPPEPAEPLATFSGLDPAQLPLPDTAEHLTLSHACASVAFAVLLGRDWLTAGLADAVLVVGATVLNPCEYAGMAVVRALSPRAVRPFDVDRDGTGLGEGAGALLLERATTARARGLRPIARLAGGDCRIAPAAGAAADQDTITACLIAALGPTTVDYVHAHATGTPQGDAVELDALGAVGRERRWSGVPVSSHKGAVGHLMQSAGFPALIAALGALRDGAVPGTAGLVRPMPAPPPVAHVPASRRHPVRSALVNSFGFGGNTAALVLTAEEDS
jgi:3-oxoacyl-[acyl-carrier-protein] synthase II